MDPDEQLIRALQAGVMDEPDDPPDHDPATLCPGEPPTKVHTIHLPEG